MQNYINEMQWYNNYAAAFGYGDNRKQELIRYFRELDSVPNEMRLEICQRGSQLAKSLQEPFWEMFFLAHQAEVLRNLKRFKERFDYSVRLVVEMGRPQYASCPMLGRGYLQFVDAYFHHDPISHRSAILKGIEYVEKNLSISLDTHLKLFELRTAVHTANEDWAEAKETALEYQKMAEFDSYHQFRSATYLAEALYFLGEYALIFPQSEVLLTVRADNYFYWAHHLAGLYWQSTATCLSKGRQEAKSYDIAIWDFERKNRQLQPQFSTLSAEFYNMLARDKMNVNYVYDTTSTAFDQRVPYLEARLALRSYYLAKRFSLSNQISYAIGMIIRVLKLNKIKSLVELPRLPILISLPLMFIIGFCLVVAGCLCLPLFRADRDAKGRLLKFLRGEEEREFFEERLRWIEETRDYVP